MTTIRTTAPTSAEAGLAAQLHVPALSGLQHQGDVSIIPRRMVGGAYVRPTTPVPTAGVPVVVGENGGNTHLLLAPGGGVCYDPSDGGVSGLDYGHLRVESGTTARLSHPEHGDNDIAPGEYVLRRKREQADESRIVAD